MPRRRRKCLAQASTQAPVLPAETKASARPSATARTPTSSELSRRLTASRGSSAMPIASVAWRMAMCSGLYETPSSTFWMRRSSPTSRHSMSVASETWATPCTTASGAWSPPMASTAMVGMLALPRQAHPQRAGIDAHGERLPSVDREHRDLVAVRGREGRVRVHVDQLEGERDVARHPLDHGPHLVAERALRPGVEGELDHG